MGLGSLVCARTFVCVCVCVCVCARVCAHASGGTPLCAYRAHECNVTLETEITCRRVNKTNNVRQFSLFNKRTRYRPVLLER